MSHPAGQKPADPTSFDTTFDTGGNSTQLVSEGHGGDRSHPILTVTSGIEAGRVVPVTPGNGISLGRAHECTLCFRDRGLSRLHARVFLDGTLAIIRDEGSRNGSFVNGKRIGSVTLLQEGDSITLGANTTLRFSWVSAAEEDALRRSYENAVKDALTGVFNRKVLETRLDLELAIAQREQSVLSLIIIDIDHFKRVNDTHGHLAGDAVLRHVATIFADNRRPQDLVTRYGGEEFVIVMPQTDLLTAATHAERLRSLVETRPVHHGARAISVTSSAGVASTTCCGPTFDKARLIAVADARLYRAKQSGRNRVHASDTP